MATIGSRIKELRKRAGLTQQDLASKLQIAKSTLGMYEINKNEPNSEMLNKIADFFDVQVDYLIGRSDDPSPINKNDEYDYRKDPTVSPELKELLDILVTLPLKEQEDIIQLALTYAAGKKARDRSTSK